MWEAIRDNRRRSWILVGFMLVLLLAMGWVIGFWLFPPGQEWWGAVGAACLWAILWLLGTAGGDGLVLFAAGAHEISKEDAPQLWNVVEEMSIASGLGGKMPRVYLIHDTMPNAFAVGRRQENAAVAVTSGLLARLNRDELQGVVAHEIGHIVNRDVSFMVMCSVMVGTIVILSEILLRAVLYSGGRRRSSRDSGGGGAVLVVVGLVAAILAPVLAQVIYFACSRKREYLADASAARYTRYPEGLASALGKISGKHRSTSKPSRALAPLYIVNPLSGMSAVSLFATHPPIEKRIGILRAMSGAGFKDYNRAFQQVAGGQSCIGARAVAGEGQPVAIREAAVEKETEKDAAARLHSIADLAGHLAGLVTISCACGVGIKVPPGVKRDSVACPRCGRENGVPGAFEKADGKSDAAGARAPLRYQRKGSGWETFRCDCGRTIQLSPGLLAPTVKCRSCRREIELV